MQKEEMFRLMNENPVLHLATVDGDQPRVRAMLLFRADEEGIIFHTASCKDVFAQIKQNPKVELCFQCGAYQVRACGVLEQVFDDNLKEEIFNHPSRTFLQKLKENGTEGLLQIFRMKSGTMVDWTFERNFAPKEPVLF